jgi:hypothetical protein
LWGKGPWRLAKVTAKKETTNRAKVFILLKKCKFYGLKLKFFVEHLKEFI